MCELVNASAIQRPFFFVLSRSGGEWPRFCPNVHGGNPGYFCQDDHDSIAMDAESAVEKIRSIWQTRTVIVVVHKAASDWVEHQFDLYRRLARLLPHDLPVYFWVMGFAKQAEKGTIEELFKEWLARQNAANDCIREVRRRLCCMGGVTNLFLYWSGVEARS